MTYAACVRCGRTSDIEELGGGGASRWLHCAVCGHVWREAGPELDVFSLILASRAAAATPIPEQQAAGRVPRASRFVMRLPVRYRTTGEASWREGMTENISRSGMLFLADRSVEPHTRIEMLFVLPGSVVGEPASRVRCRGEIVRTEARVDAGARPVAAASVTEYRLAAR